MASHQLTLLVLRLNQTELFLSCLFSNENPILVNLFFSGSSFPTCVTSTALLTSASKPSTPAFKCAKILASGVHNKQTDKQNKQINTNISVHTSARNLFPNTKMAKTKMREMGQGQTMQTGEGLISRVKWVRRRSAENKTNDCTPPTKGRSVDYCSAQD